MPCLCFHGWKHKHITLPVIIVSCYGPTFSTVSNVDFVWITLPNLPEKSKQNIRQLKLTNNGAQNGLVCWYRMESGA